MSAARAQTTAGLVEGVDRDGVTQFLGIPFAAPVLGERRFQPPSPGTRWTGVRRADAVSPSPPQLPPPLAVFAAEQAPNNEDCLQLNVYTPRADATRRPVMVWFYGGGFTIGSASAYDASSLSARGDVVVVTVNYRLGALGFSHLEHIDERFKGSANVGILDQVASLKWVRDNIAGFGGDPGCVTIFGESAGGHSVGCLLTSPEARDLFHRCILQSSAGWGLRTTEWAAEVTAKLMAEVNVTTVEQLQGADVDVILAAQALLPLQLPGADSNRTGPRSLGVGATPFAPTLDGVVLHGAVIDEVAGGSAAKVPVLICHTRDELQIFAAMGVLPPLGDDNELGAMMALSLPDPNAAVEAYRSADPQGSLSDLLVSFLTDQNIHMPDFRLAEVRIRHDPRVWMARFSWHSPGENSKLGACHGIEIPFLFGRPGQTGGLLEGHDPPIELVHTLQDAWIAFARSGNPNCAGLPEWPRYEEVQRAVMNFDAECEVLHDPDGAVRTLWDHVVL